MNSIRFRRGLAALALGAAATAQAGVVDFEDVAPNFFLPGDSFTSGADMLFTVPALGVGIIDSAAGFASFGNAPTGNNSQFYGGLNDNNVKMERADGRAFSLTGFDFGFITPAPVRGAASPGFLVALWEGYDGSSGLYGFDLGSADANGKWPFLQADWSAPSVNFTMSTAGVLRSVEFLVCISNGVTCDWPSNNLAQFGLDNIEYQLPVPGTWLLAGLGLAGLAASRRRAVR